jgi:lysylphosphatidylglycerol synthetase-like protein (DUF2156 family)
MALPASGSVFSGTIEFFKQLGVYDVILPFLLVFTLVFAMLEKTRIFGTEKVDGKDITRKNLNGMTAFVMAFFVVASTQLVAAISKVLASTVMLLLLSFCFLLLAGSFHTGKEEFFLKKPWKNIFMVIMFVGIILVFLGSFQYDDKSSWLDFLWFQVTNNISSITVSSIVLIAIVIGFMFYVTKEPGHKKEEKEE